MFIFFLSLSLSCFLISSLHSSSITHAFHARLLMYVKCYTFETEGCIVSSYPCDEAFSYVIVSLFSIQTVNLQVGLIIREWTNVRCRFNLFVKSYITLNIVRLPRILLNLILLAREFSKMFNSLSNIAIYTFSKFLSPPT